MRQGTVESTGRPSTRGQEMLRMVMDTRILVITMFLMAIGVSLVLSSSSFFAGGKFGDEFALMRNHATRCLVAVVVLFLASRVDYRVYRKAAPMLLLTGLVLMAGLFVFGANIRDTQRWYIIPFIKTTLQPSEIARTGLVFFLAYWIAKRGNDIADFRRGFLPAAAAIGLVAGLSAAMPNFGTAVATILISLIILFVGGARLLHIGAFMAAGAALAAFALIRYDYVRERVAAFLGHGGSPTGMNWQVDQSLIALGSGGLFGVGFGHSEQKLSWLPDAYTDFIFSIVGEEGGLLFTLLVSGAFLAITLRALKISHECSDRFGQLLGVGIAASLFVYAILNMYVVTGLFPVTGLPLPFLSYGGSALVVNAFAVGVLLNLSRRRVSARRGAPMSWAPWPAAGTR
ncbi:MAG: putative lipid II flippase FtsW [Candidatus Krumholzibacteria bacterium]|nr:putative lipid II flippase FtsW [Candidatus Krumholzibacteria bacterium]MDH4336671.1 putative lipid II flippase FtsW [Candidatus Krumholzibacteria bacterium]MDH5269014.1 putative lipid II flippase FtsW [Candidatus Krumholzibacteria bacterium]